MGQVSNGELKLMMEQLSENVSQCIRTLRGSNGDKGLCTLVSLNTQRIDANSGKLDEIDQKIENLSKSVNNDIMHAITNITPESASNGAKSDEEETKKDKIKFGSWEWFTEKAGMPVLVAVLVSFLTWFLTSILPDLLVHLQR